MKVSELSGALLDYWVARTHGWEIDPYRQNHELQIRIKDPLTYNPDYLHSQDGFTYALCGSNRPYSYSPSTDWRLGGVIIECDRITVSDYPAPRWRAMFNTPRPHPDPKRNPSHHCYDGPAPLIAAMRTKVSAHYGDEVPDELS